MSNDPLKDLEEISEKYRQAYGETQHKIRILKDIPKAISLVGKCFKYRNSFGSSQPPWWFYIRITGRDGISLLFNCFQEDANDHVEFEYGKSGYVEQFSHPSNYLPITAKEYFTAEKKLLNKMMRRHKRNSKGIK